MARKRRFGTLEPKFAANLNDGVARNAFEDARVDWRSAELAVLNDKDVVAGALADVALMVEHERFFATRVVRLDLRQNIIQVVEGLHARVKGVGRIANRARGYDLDTLLIEVGGIEGERLRDHDDLRIVAEVRVKTERPDAASNDEANIRVSETVCFNRRVNRVDDFILRHRNLNVERFRGIP